MQVAGKQARPHWRSGDAGRRGGRSGWWRRTRRRCVRIRETVLRAFYDFHLDAGSGPVVNPFPLDRSRRGGRAHAHHNPMEPYRSERSGLYRPRVPGRIPRSVPDEEFNEIFARLPSHRDRALVAFYVSTGARASELLSATRGGRRPGTAADHGGPEGNPRAAGAAGLHRTRSCGCGSTRWRWPS